MTAAAIDPAIRLAVIVAAVLGTGLALSLIAMRRRADAPDSGGDGRPVVLIHGWPLSAESWDEQTDALVAAGVEEEGAVFVDVTDRFRGHGVGSADPWILFGPDAGDHTRAPRRRRA